ncbi:unnamed protein product [Cylindrotheca closterium]|uniref:Uncharacterized protein n=1 Tax=Cylindrotheca closterium TaxID=2856 RepID=A0AAD2PTZ0_9STRA|nr:unnamed protein product [Cylindrotheca closterium]
MAHEKVIEYGSKKSYLLKRRSSARRVGSFRRSVMDSINDNVESNPLHRFASCGDIQAGTKDDSTAASSVTSSFSSLPGGSKRESDDKDSKQNAEWGSNRSSSNRIKLMDRGELLVETDTQSSRFLRQDL